MDWILPKLAIGSYIDAQASDLGDMVETVVCLKENCDCRSREDVLAFSEVLVDGIGNSAARVTRILDYLHAALTDGDRVLVHCHAGRSRSVAIVARYLMAVGDMSRQQAIRMIAEKREIYLTPGIETVLDVHWLRAENGT